MITACSPPEQPLHQGLTIIILDGAEVTLLHTALS